MHGLINRTVESFVSDAYGEARWHRILQNADVGIATFEAMLMYEDQITFDVLDAVSEELAKPRDVVLEDIGIYLVSHPNTEALRRLLRFAGVDFVDFLHSLEELPERARLAVPDIDLPTIQLSEQNTSEFSLELESPQSIFGPVFFGILQAMADDYGTLVFLDQKGRSGSTDRIAITVIDTDFSDGRDFTLAKSPLDRRRTDA